MQRQPYWEIKCTGKWIIIRSSTTPTARAPKEKKGDDLHEDGSITVSESDKKGIDKAGALGLKKTIGLYVDNKRNRLVATKKVES